MYEGLFGEVNNKAVIGNRKLNLAHTNIEILFCDQNATSPILTCIWSSSVAGLGTDCIASIISRAISHIIRAWRR